MRLENLAGFRPVGVTLVAFFIVNLTVFGIVTARPSLLHTLALTPDQPSGIVTANFTHHDPFHLAGNLVTFTVMCVLFVSVNTFADKEKRRRLSRIFGSGCILAGIAADAIQFGIWRAEGASGIGTVGASGIVYGAIGIAFVSALYNLPGHLRRARMTLHPKQICSAWQGKTCLMWQEPPEHESPDMLFPVFTFSVFMVFSFVYMVLFQAGSFFYVSPGVAWFSHAVGFVFGLLTSALVIFLLLCLDSWHKCGCLFCCIPKDGQTCHMVGHARHKPICRT